MCISECYIVKVADSAVMVTVMTRVCRSADFFGNLAMRIF